MAKFLTTTGTSSEIENIIIEAKSNLVLISPYLQISKNFCGRLHDSLNMNVSVKIICRKNDLKPAERGLLESLSKLDLYSLNELHAKCYYNETKMVITSMNLYAFSEKNNREMGILIDRIDDKDIYEKAVKEAESIIRSATQESIPNLNKKKLQHVQSKSPQPKNVAIGCCIRCSGQIKFNPNRPYCGECFSIWVQFENPEYEEYYCHSCGEEDSTCMDEPLCYSCDVGM